MDHREVITGLVTGSRIEAPTGRGDTVDKVTTERIFLLKKQAAEQLNAVWDAEEAGDHELAEWHWSVFARLMRNARELTEQRRYRYGKRKNGRD